MGGCLPARRGMSSVIAGCVCLAKRRRVLSLRVSQELDRLLEAGNQRFDLKRPLSPRAKYRLACLWYKIGPRYMKKLKHEAELFKAALLAGVRYAQGRKAVEFEATDSARDKALYVYRLLVHDKVISPMPEDQVGEKTIRHRLATWYAHQLPEGHPLLD